MDQTMSLVGVIVPILSIVFGFGITGLVVWLVVVPIFKRSAEKSRLMQAGVHAEGTLVGAEQTGTFINNNPVVRLLLDVRMPGRPVYRVTVTETIDLVSLSQLTPGKELLLKVDPLHPEKVAIRGDKPRWGGQASAAEILATGIPGQAKVVRTWDMGLVPDGSGDPAVGFEVVVQVQDGRPPYQVQFGHRVPKHIAPPVAGAILPVRVSPQDPSRVAIDFSGASQGR